MPDSPETSDPHSSAKAIFAALALGSVIAGLVIYLLQGQMGIPAETARNIATVFVIVGVGDALLLYLWDFIFKRRE